FAFESSNRGQLRISEYDIQQQRMVDRFEVADVSGMAGGQFALLDGNVNNLVWPGAVARGVNMRRGGLLPAGDNDLAIVPRAHTGCSQVEGGGIGFASERVEKVVGAAGNALAAVREAHRCATFVLADFFNLRPRKQLDAFVDERLLHDGRGV